MARGRNPSYSGTRRHISSHVGTRAHDLIIADSYTAKNHCILPDQDLFAD
ncbi:hypothetical protein [Rothia sp. CCM 9416]